MYIKIKVKPSSKKEDLERLNDDTFILSTKRPAEDGEANGRVLEVIGKIYPGKSVRIVSGHLKRSKIIEIK